MVRSRIPAPESAIMSALLLATVLLLASPPAAMGQTFGSWSAGFVDSRTAPYAYAYTENDSGQLLGQFCYPKGDSCVWLVAMSTGCEKGQKYPVLVNSDAGAESMEVYCAGELGDSPRKSTYAFSAFDKINQVVVKGGWLGIAIPLADRDFGVIRFDIRGAAPAVRAMRESAAGKISASPAGNPRREAVDRQQ